MERHRQAGYAILALLLFRVFWGFAGSRTARLPSSSRGRRPFARICTARWTMNRRDRAQPAWRMERGGAAVGAAGDHGGRVVCRRCRWVRIRPACRSGELDQGRAAAEWHETAFKAALALIGLHIFAIACYQMLIGHNLIGPMITGKRARGKDDAAPDVRWSSAMALGGMAGVGAVTWAVMTGFRFFGGA